MRLCVVALALVLLCVPLQAAHITDKLVVGLYADQKLDGEPRQLLTTGTPVEVLKRAKDAIRVRLADDTRGWLEARYVSEEKPAAMKLLEVQAELRTLRTRLEAKGPGSGAPAESLPSAERIRAGLALNEARARIAELEQQLGNLPQVRAAIEERDELRQRMEQVREIVGGTGLASKAGETPGESLWDRYLPWVVAGLMAAVGFAAGVGFIDHRIRRRYGGLRF